MPRILRTKTARIFGIILLAIAALLALLSLSESYVKHKVPVAVIGHHVYTDGWDTGYVGLEGTWVIDNAEQAFPLQVSNIVCRSSTNTCIESLAQVSKHVLVVGQEAFEIVQWDSNLLTYKTSANCVDYVYSINRATKQVSGIRTLRPGMESECPNVEKEFRLRLTDGYQVYRNLQEEVRPVAINIIALLLILLWAGYRIVRIVKS